MDIQGLHKVMETLQILHTFLYKYCVGPSFAFSTATTILGMNWYKFEQTLAEFYNSHREEHLQVTLGMVDVGICSSLQSPKLTRVVH
jgi:hypothetical protein